MRRASAVSVWRAVFVALAFTVLVFAQSGPVGAQTDPLARQTANIEANKIGPIAVAGCEADRGATARVTIDDGDNDDADERTFTDGSNAEFRFGQQGITITPSEDDEQDFLEGLETGTGSVVGSEGITCTNGGNGGAQPVTPAEDEYGSNEVMPETIPEKPLPKTGGAPIILGGGVLLALAALLSIKVLRP